ncbi:MAG: hypothetical protein ABIQ53_00690 [Terracoccus sp.]
MSGPSDSDPTDGPPRSVAAEAALLVELLSQRGSFGGPSANYGTRSGNGSGNRSGNRSGPHTEPDTGSAALPDDGECTCGGVAPAACRVCPVCQVIAFVQKINPETIERMADFAAFAATTLREVASAQRTRSGRETEAREGAEPDGDDPGPATGDRP